MDKITAEVQIENAVDWIRAEGDGGAPIRSVTTLAHVDTGVTELCVGEDVARPLGLREVRRVGLVLADGRETTAPVVGPVRVTVLGRSVLHELVVLPPGTEALLGTIVLGALDLIVDPSGRRLLARDKRGPFLSAKTSAPSPERREESHDAERSEAVATLARTFGLDEQPARLSASPTLSWAAVRRFLIERIERLLDGNLALLMSLLYRVDVRERDVQRVLAESPPDRLPADLTDLIIERLLEKIRLRRRYRERGHS